MLVIERYGESKYVTYNNQKYALVNNYTFITSDDLFACLKYAALWTCQSSISAELAQWYLYDLDKLSSLSVVDILHETVKNMIASVPTS